MYNSFAEIDFKAPRTRLSTVNIINLRNEIYCLQQTTFVLTQAFILYKYVHNNNIWNIIRAANGPVFIKKKKKNKKKKIKKKKKKKKTNSKIVHFFGQLLYCP